VGKFSTGGILLAILDRDLIKGEDWSRSVNSAPGSEKEETERMADSEDKEVSLCITERYLWSASKAGSQWSAVID